MSKLQLAKIGAFLWRQNVDSAVRWAVGLTVVYEIRIIIFISPKVREQNMNIT